MAGVKRANTSGITKTGTAIPDVPNAPTIGTATQSGSNVSVPFTPAVTGGTVTTYTATSTPGSITGTSATSPISVSGLTAGTSYTFKVKGTNATATGAESSASNSVTPTYAGQTVTGGSGYTNSSTFWETITPDNTTLTTGGSPHWTCSNQGTYYGGAQTNALGGTASFRYSLNNGNALPAGTYSYSGLQYLFWSAGGESHDGMYLWAVTSSQKLTIVNSVSPPDPLNTLITKTGTFTLASSTTVYLNWEIYDGSSGTSMGGRVYNFTVTKTA